MKNLIISALILFGFSVAEAQWTKMYTWRQTATTSWTSISKPSYAKIRQFCIAVESTTDSDTLWVAFNNDTTATNIWPMSVVGGVGESDFFSSVDLTNVRVKSNGSVVFKIRVH